MSVKELEFKEGVKSYECDSFRDFIEHVFFGMGKYDTHFIWRGQRNSSWEISSSLKVADIREYRLLVNFYRLSGGLTKEKYDIDNLEEDRTKLWSLGQHHGLKTPLIDFTQFPFVALFFAYCEKVKYEQDKFRAVYALDWESVIDINWQIKEPAEEFWRRIPNYTKDEEFKKILIEKYAKKIKTRNAILENRLSKENIETLIKWEFDSAKQKQLKKYEEYSGVNARIQRQGGLHLYTPENESVEEWCRKNYQLQSIKQRAILHKYLLPDEERISILKALNKMNINYSTLFPDLDGAAKHCNLAGEIGDGDFSSQRNY